MTYALSATLAVDCPAAMVGDLDGKLIAAVPSDVTNAVANINDQSPSSIAGNFLVTATLTATVSQGDIGTMVTAVEAALIADGAVLVSIALQAK